MARGSQDMSRVRQVGPTFSIGSPLCRLGQEWDDGEEKVARSSLGTIVAHQDRRHIKAKDVHKANGTTSGNDPVATGTFWAGTATIFSLNEYLRDRWTCWHLKSSPKTMTSQNISEYGSLFRCLKYACNIMTFRVGLALNLFSARPRPSLSCTRNQIPTFPTV